MEEMRKAALAYFSNSIDEHKQFASEWFRKMDANGDGSISFQEYISHMQSLGFQSISDPSIFRELDKDGNGNLNFEEFITLFYICLSGRLVFCDGCRVFLKGLYFTCVQCFDTRSFDLCCDCFQRKNYIRHADAVFYDNYALLRSRRNPSSRTSPPLPSSSRVCADAVFYDNNALLGSRRHPSSGTSPPLPSSSRNKTKQFLKNLDEGVGAFVTGFNIGSSLCNIV